MEIKQRYVVSYLHRTGMKLPAIVAGPAAVSHKGALDENSAKYWLHEIKLHRSDLSDRLTSSRPLLGDIDARICKSRKLSHGLRFERSMNSSKFLRRSRISI
jgi:hypothetical protein